MKIDKKILFILTIFIITLIVYLKSIAIDVTPEDSGELATAAYSLGIPHPPGYPLWVLIAKLFSFLPFISIIYKINFLSSFFGALTVSIFFYFLLNKSNDYLLSFSLSLTLAFSRIYWSQSIIAEVYTLNSFLLILYLFFVDKLLNNFKYIDIVAFFTGLLVVSHYSNILVILPTLFFIWGKYKSKIFKIKFLIEGVFPLSLYFLLMIRANSNPLINWGNPFNISNLLFHILRLSFGSMVKTTSPTFTLFFKQVQMFFKLYFFNFTFLLGLFLLLLFILSLKKIRNEKYGILYLILLFFTSIGIIIVLNFRVTKESFFINRVFFIPFFIIFLYFISFYFSHKRVNYLFVLIPMLLFFINFKYNNRSKEWQTKIYNMNILRSIDYKSNLFTAKDFSTFPLLYYTKVEYIRPDIKIYDWFGNVFEDIFHNKYFHLLPDYKKDEIRYKISDEIRLNSKRETYYTFQRDTLDRIKSLGLVYTYNKSLPLIDFTYFHNLNVATNHIEFMDYFLKNMISVYYFHFGFFYKQEGNMILSKKYFNLSNKFGGNKAKELLNLAVNAMKINRLDEAEDLLLKAINSDSTLDLPYLYLGNIYFQKGELKKAERMYIKAILNNPLNAMAYNNLGNIYMKRGELAKAKEIFKSGLKTGYGKIFNNLALIYIKENDLNKAEYYLKEGIKYQKEFLPLYLNLSVVLSKENKWEEAEKYLLKSLQYGKDYKIYLNLSLVYIKLRKYQKAKKLLEYSMKEFPDKKIFSFYYKKLNNVIKN